MKINNNVRKKALAGILSMAMVGSMFQGTDIRLTIKAEETGTGTENPSAVILSTSQYATPEQLTDSDIFTLDSEKAGTAGLVYFGNKNTRWYIAGSQNEDELVLVAKDPLITNINLFNDNNHPPFDTDSTDILIDSSHGVYANPVTSVYQNHYGASYLRQKLTEISSDEAYFLAWQQNMLCATTYNNYDIKNDCYYTLTDKLYPMSLDSTGTRLAVGSDDQLKITSSNLLISESRSTWLRTAATMSPQYIWAYNGIYVGIAEFAEKAIGAPGVAISPAATIDLKDVLWASTVPINNSPQDGAMRFRYRDDEAELGNVYIRPDKNEIRLSGVPDSATLVLQSDDRYLTSSVGDYIGQKLSPTTVSPSLDSFDGFKIWIEKTGTDGKTIAVEAIQDEKYSVSANLFNATLTDSVYSEGTSNLAQVSVKNGVVGVGAFSISYECNGNVVSTPEEPGLYEVYVDVEQGVNYQAAQHIYLGKFTIRSIVTAADLRYKAPTDLRCDGNVKTANVSPISDGLGSISVKYLYDKTGTFVKSPIMSGGYTVYADVSQGQLFSATSDIEMGHFTLKLYPSADELTYTAPDSLIVDGEGKNATVTPKEGVSGLGDITVKYKRNGTDTYMDSLPQDEGQYEVYACLAESDTYLAADIYVGEFSLKLQIGTELELAVDKFTYDGNEKAADVRAKVAGIGAISATKYKKIGESDYMTGTPCDVGIYEVYVDVEVGSSYVAATDVFVGTLAIKNAVTKDCFVNLSSFTATYYGYPVTVEVTAKDEISGLGDFTVNYRKVGETDYLTEAPVEPGDYQVFVTVEEGALYYAASDVLIIEYKIRKQASAATFSFKAPENTVYNGEEKIATVTPTSSATDLTESDFIVIYRDTMNQDLSSPPIAGGDYFVYAKVSNGAIYRETGYIYLGSFQISDNSFRDTNLDYSLPVSCVYDGHSKALQVSYKEGITQYGDIELYYKKGNQAAIISDPIEAGDYRAYANIYKKSTDGGSPEIEISGIYLTDFTIIDSDKRFVTKNELLTDFRLTEGYSTGTLKFGFCNDDVTDFNGAREWYIAGIDQQNDNSLALLAKMPFITPYSYYAENGYGDDSYVDFYDFDTDYNAALLYYFSNPQTALLNGTMKSLLSIYEQSSDYFTAAEMERMKSTTVTSRALSGLTNDLFTNVTGKLYLPDAEDKSVCYDDLNSSRRTTIYVGTKNNIPIDLNRIAPVEGAGLERVASFWLRSISADSSPAFLQVLTVNCQTDKQTENSYINSSPPNDTNKLIPAVDLDMSQVLFASNANPAEGDGAMTTDDAMTLRYLDSNQILGGGSLSDDGSSVSISGATAENEYLVVQSANDTYAKKVTGSVTIQASDVDSSLESFDGCQVWLEKTDKTQRETIASVISSTEDLDEELPYVDYSKKVSANFRLDSSLTSGNAQYKAGFMADYAGTLTLYDAKDAVIAQDIPIDPKTDADFRAEIALSLSKGTNIFRAVFTPFSNALQGSLLGEYETLIETPTTIEFDISFKEFRTQENVIYVSNNGTPLGKGSKGSPLDVYTAVAYAKPGQFIVLLSDIELESALIIPRGLSGTEDKPITIMSDPENSTAYCLSSTSNIPRYILLQGDYFHFYNIDFQMENDKGYTLTISGNHNTVEKCIDYGLTKDFVSIGGSRSERPCMWPSNNSVISCSVSANQVALPSSAGFVATAFIGTDNIFRYCIASGKKTGFYFGESGVNNDVSVKAEQCVASLNINGFYIDGQSLSATLEHCIAYGNADPNGTDAGSGLYITSDKGSCTNCTLYLNNRNILTARDSAKGFKAKDCIIYSYNEASYDNQLAQENLDSCSDSSTVTEDMFESLDIYSKVPVIAEDGSIDMDGLLTLTALATNGDGAILSNNPNPTELAYTDIDECPSHNYVNGICTECHAYLENPTAQEIHALASIAETYIADAQTYTTKSINAITSSLTRVETVTDYSSQRLREEIFKGIADALAEVIVATATVTLSSDPADLSVIASDGRYAVGDKITLRADLVNGYAFNGWFRGTELDDVLYSTDRVTSYEINQDDTSVIFTAHYTYNGNKNLSIIIGTGSVTYSTDNGNTAGTWNEDITDASYDIGTSFTIEAIPTTDAQFLYWLNSDSGRILTEDSVYSFCLGEDLSLEACYEQKAPEKHYVVYKDMNGSILWSGDVDNDTTIDEPAHGFFEGYEFDGWYKEVTGEAEVYTARYTRVSGFTVTVTGGTIAGAKETYSYGDLVTATAEENDGTKFFSGWYEGEILVSDQLSYSFYVTANTELTATYQGDEVLQQQPMLRMEIGTRQAVENNEQILPIHVIWSLTEGYTFVGAGLVRTYLDDRTGDLLLEFVDGTNIKKNSTKLTTSAGNYAFTLRIAETSTLNTLYSKGYLIYKDDATGEVITVYTDLNTGEPLD